MVNTAIRPAVVDAIAELTGNPAAAISDEDDLVDDLDVDSMLAVNLLVAIEDRLGSALPDGCEGSLAATRTVGELVRCLAVAFAGSSEGPAHVSSGSM
jgi:acyl carrier protein